jgi:uncharacterized membrane protein
VPKERLAAFSDGVLAILITIMVLELKAPEGTALADLRPLVPVFLSYVLSFVYIGIYWNNHHHLIGACGRVNGGILWANLHLLFWLSLVPWATSWMGEHHFDPVPTAFYGVPLLMAGVAYWILQAAIVRKHGQDSELARALGVDVKGKVSVVAYAVGIPLAGVSRWISVAIYAAVAISWLVPDRRLEPLLTRGPAR